MPFGGSQFHQSQSRTGAVRNWSFCRAVDKAQIKGNIVQILHTKQTLIKGYKFIAESRMLSLKKGFSCFQGLNFKIFNFGMENAKCFIQ